MKFQNGILSIAFPTFLLSTNITPIHTFSFLIRRSSPNSITTTRISTRIYMGLYDEDDDELPDKPTDYLKNRRTRDDIRNQKLGTFVNTDDYLPDEKDEFGRILPDADISSNLNNLNNDDNDDDDDEMEDSVLHLFEWNLDGSEKNSQLPDLQRTLHDGIPCYFEATDKKTQIVMDKTECSVHDACWALEAHEGKLMEAMIDIAMAQRNALNQAVALPDQEEVKKTDWDAELQQLNIAAAAAGNRKLELGEEFEQAGYSVGMDGLEERKETLRNRDKMNEFKRLFDSKEDQDWIPGKQNPQPDEDEPWFTG